MTDQFVMVHQLSLRKCRILKNINLQQQLSKRFKLNDQENLQMISDNEYAIIQQQQDNNNEFITITLNNDTQQIQVIVQRNDPISILEQFIQKTDNQNVYFYYGDLQLLTQFTMQQYNLQSNDIIKYKLIDKQQNIQIFVRCGDELITIILNSDSIIQTILNEMYKRNDNLNYYKLFYLTSILNPQYTLQQLAIKQGYILNFRYVLNLDEGLNKYHLVIQLPQNIEMYLSISQNSTPQQLIQSLLDLVSANNNLIRCCLVYFNKLLTQNQELVYQDIEDGDELGIIQQVENVVESELSLKDDLSSEQQQNISSDSLGLYINIISRILEDKFNKQLDMQAQARLDMPSQDKLDSISERYQQFPCGKQVMIPKANLNIRLEQIEQRLFALNEELKKQQKMGIPQKQIQKPQQIQYQKRENHQQIQQVQFEQNQQLQQKQSIKRVKTGLIARFSCQKRDCLTKMSKIYQSFGLGKFIFSRLVFQCPICGSKDVLNRKFGLVTCQYIIINKNKVLEEGTVKNIQFLDNINKIENLEEIKIITTQ